MADDTLTTAQAAERLNTTRTTVRNLIESDELRAERLPRGERFSWAVDAASVAQLLERHGPYEGTRRRTRLARLEREVSATRLSELDRLREERDDLRAHNVALADALARSRAAADAQERADAERAVVVRHLLAAAEAAERADEQRRGVVAELQEAAAAFTRPGHPGQLRQGEAG